MRLPRCCKRCALQRILSSNSLTLALVVAFSAGLLVFIVGTLLVRYADVISSWMPGKASSDRQIVASVDTRAMAILALEEPIVAQPVPTPTLVPATSTLRVIDIPEIEPGIDLPWTHDVVGSNVDVGPEEKLDMIERLLVLDSPWSRSVLERARIQEDDPRIMALLATKPGSIA